jgi:regulator of cell morphogenesis and NO signaling
MQTLTPNPTVREIAAGSLAAVRVFEKRGIDYCCGGARPLAEVCHEKGLDLAEVEREIEAASTGATEGGRDWNTAPLTELIRHIVDTHHAYLRGELPALEARLAKVYRVYNERYGPTLTGLPEVFAALKSELELHMCKEEQILFPAVARYEAAIREGGPLPTPSFGSVAAPIGVMEAEHESAGRALASIREITGEFSVPEYACPTYRALIGGLEELEGDLHMHIHLENNILFPRAQQLEASRR